MADIQPCLRHLGNSERGSPTLKRWAILVHPFGMEPPSAVCSPLPSRFGGGDQRGGELFVEGKEVFHPVPVVGERLRPLTAVPRAVQLLVRCSLCRASSHLGTSEGKLLSGVTWRRILTQIHANQRPLQRKALLPGPFDRGRVRIGNVPVDRLPLAA